jgi:hypothetical protein
VPSEEEPFDKIMRDSAITPKVNPDPSGCQSKAATRRTIRFPAHPTVFDTVSSLTIATDPRVKAATIVKLEGGVLSGCLSCLASSFLKSGDANVKSDGPEFGHRLRSARSTPSVSRRGGISF